MSRRSKPYEKWGKLHCITRLIPKQMWEYPEVTDRYCKHFGCGNKLTLPESLYGDRCLFHQCPEKTIDIVNKYVSK
jgi:hypothetical protein